MRIPKRYKRMPNGHTARPQIKRTKTAIPIAGVNVTTLPYGLNPVLLVTVDTSKNQLRRKWDFTMRIHGLSYCQRTIKGANGDESDTTTENEIVAEYGRESWDIAAHTTVYAVVCTVESLGNFVDAHRLGKIPCVKEITLASTAVAPRGGAGACDNAAARAAKVKAQKQAANRSAYAGRATNPTKGGNAEIVRADKIIPQAPVAVGAKDCVIETKHPFTAKTQAPDESKRFVVRELTGLQIAHSWNYHRANAIKARQEKAETAKFNAEYRAEMLRRILPLFAGLGQYISAHHGALDTPIAPLSRQGI